MSYAMTLKVGANSEILNFNLAAAFGHHCANRRDFITMQPNVDLT